MAVTLTDSAASHVSHMLAKRGHGLGLRIGTKKSGCTGFAYVVDYADDLGDDDQIFESHGVKVVVDQGQPGPNRRYGGGLRQVQLAERGLRVPQPQD